MSASAKKHYIDKVHKDKGYNDRKNFNILDEINAKPAIPKKFKGQKVEAGLKVILYNKFISPIIEQQLSRNIIALYFAAIKLQAISNAK